MLSISEVSSLTGVSARTLHYYDEIGLLPPTQTTAAGYRQYGAQTLERLQHILLLRELGFPLKEIRRLLDSPDFDREKALDQHIELLTRKKQHLENLIDLARGIRLMGTNNLDFSAFDTRDIDRYADEARQTWGQTPAYKEFEQGFMKKSSAAQDEAARGLMDLLARFGRHRCEEPDSPALIALAEELQAYMSAHFYTCTDQILLSLADMYDGGGAFTRNINKHGGDGTAEKAAQAIRAYVAGKSA